MVSYRARSLLALMVCSVVATVVVDIAPAPPARAIALVLVLFMQDGKPHVMRSDGSHNTEITTEVNGQQLSSSRDHPLAMYQAEDAINEVLLRLNGPYEEAAYQDYEIAIHSPLEGIAMGWRYLTDNGDDESWPSFPTEAGKAAPRIAFMSNRDGDNEIYVMDREGGDVRQLTTNTTDDSEPSWTPDGKIVFTSDRDGDADIYIMASDGSAVSNLTSDSTVVDSQPNVSPDGTSVAFMSERSGFQDVYLMDIDGSDPKKLTDSLTADFAPVWSPYGDLIFYASGRDGDYDVWSMTTSGEILANLTNNSVADHPVDATFIPPRHRRSITLAIDRQGTATGRVRDRFALARCFSDVKVFLQRKKVGGWQPVGEVKTDALGRYRFPRKAKVGSYRVLLRELRPKVPLHDLVCTRAETRTG